MSRCRYAQSDSCQSQLSLEDRCLITHGLTLDLFRLIKYSAVAGDSSAPKAAAWRYHRHQIADHDQLAEVVTSCNLECQMRVEYILLGG